MLVLLDIDGTLVDTNYLHVEAWARALHELGLVVPRAAIHRQIGKGADQFLPVFVKDEGTRKRAKELHSNYAKDLQENIFPLPGARELIEKLSACGHSMWVATSGTPQEVKERLATLKVNETSFEGIVSSSDVKHSKPQPDIFIEVLKRAKRPARDAVVIGDTQWDVEAARVADIRVIALLSGGAFSKAELKAAGAEAVYEDCADFIANGLKRLGPVRPGGSLERAEVSRAE